MKIVVFDSGRGSVYVTTLLKKELPNEEIINYQDKKNFPYGEKSTEELQVAISETIAYIERHFSPDIIVVASITPSLEVLPRILKHKLSKTRIIGACLPLSKAKGKTVLLATSRTIKSLKNNDAICIAVPEIINLIQTRNKRLKNETEKMLKQIPYFDTIILGSTHLGYIKRIIHKMYPDKLILDPYEKIIQDVKQALFGKKAIFTRSKFFLYFE